MGARTPLRVILIGSPAERNPFSVDFRKGVQKKRGWARGELGSRRSRQKEGAETPERVGRGCIYPFVFRICTYVAAPVTVGFASLTRVAKFLGLFFITLYISLAFCIFVPFFGPAALVAFAALFPWQQAWSPLSQPWSASSWLPSSVAS